MLLNPCSSQDYFRFVSLSRRRIYLSKNNFEHLKEMQAKATEWWCQELSRYRSEEQRRDLSLPPARLPTYISGLNEESEQNPPKGLNSVSLVHAPVWWLIDWGDFSVRSSWSFSHHFYLEQSEAPWSPSLHTQHYWECQRLSEHSLPAEAQVYNFTICLWVME